MAQGALDIANVHAPLHQVGGKTVAKRMGGAPRVAPGFLYCFPVYVLDALCRILTPVLPFKKPVRRPVFLVIGTQQFQKNGAEHGMSVPFALAVLDENISIIAADVLYAQP